MRLSGDDLQGQLSALRERLEDAFSPDTAAPGFVGHTPSAGQCAAVSLIAHQILGGDLVSAKVEGQSHWFNRLRADDKVLDVDVTGDQFGRPAVQVADHDKLYFGTRVRTRDEVNQETIERAVKLAERARLDQAFRGLLDLLNTQAAAMVRRTP